MPNMRVQVDNHLYEIDEVAQESYRKTVQRQQSILNKNRLVIHQHLLRNPNFPDNVPWQDLRVILGIRGGRDSVEAQRRLLRQALKQERNNFLITMDEIKRWINQGHAKEVLINIYTGQSVDEDNYEFITTMYGISTNPVLNRIDYETTTSGNNRRTIFHFRTKLPIEDLYYLLIQHDEGTLRMVVSMFGMLEEKRNELMRDAGRQNIVSRPMLVFQLGSDSDIRVPNDGFFNYNGWFIGPQVLLRSLPRSPIPIPDRLNEFIDLLGRMLGLRTPRNKGSDEVEDDWFICSMELVFEDNLQIPYENGWWML